MNYAYASVYYVPAHTVHLPVHIHISCISMPFTFSMCNDNKVESNHDHPITGRRKAVQMTHVVKEGHLLDIKWISNSNNV